MADVSAINAASRVASEPSVNVRAKQAADYDTFLTLLVTQLQNQDPLNPTDNSEYIAQLASFSAVEQQTQTNEKLDQILSFMSLTQASSLIGKQVTSADGETSGIVESVKLANDSLVAVLKSGDEVAITAGTKISDAAS